MTRITPAGVAKAAAAAAILSGIPSTAHALATRTNPFASVRAAGSIVCHERASRATRFVAGLVVHAVISLGWTAVLAVVLPRRHAAAWGALAGAGIAALDLSIADRRFPAIAELPRGAQVADHVAFGAIAGHVLARHAHRDGQATRRVTIRRAARSGPG